MYDLPVPGSGNSQHLSNSLVSRNGEMIEEKYNSQHPSSSTRKAKIQHNASMNSQSSNDSHRQMLQNQRHSHSGHVQTHSQVQTRTSQGNPYLFEINAAQKSLKRKINDPTNKRNHVVS
jgi:hypothetical protein